MSVLEMDVYCNAEADNTSFSSFLTSGMRGIKAQGNTQLLLARVSRWLGFCQAWKEIWSPATMLPPALPLQV